MTNNVLVIGDLHAPFTHPKYFDHCREVRDTIEADRIVFIGDLVDNHAISSHAANADGRSGGDESKLAQDALQKWIAEFPVADLTLGNHDGRPRRIAGEVQIPSMFLKSFEEAWGIPETWNVCMEVVHNDVLYVHGTGFSGETGHLRCAKESLSCTVIGHIHSFAGINYFNTATRIVWGMNVGCGVDVDAYAFRYQAARRRKPFLSCGAVLDRGRVPVIFPMKK